MGDADMGGEQFTVVPVHEGEQDLAAVEVNTAANADDAGGGLDVDDAEQAADGFTTFSTVTVPYDGQTEVSFDSLKLA